MDKRKTIFITGAASGIGRETALFFAREGWFAEIFDRDQEGLLSLQTDIGTDRCLLKVMDVTDPKSVAEAMEVFSEATGGRMDVLFNNAGVLQMGPNEQIPLKVQQRIVDVNLKGVLNCIHL